MRRAAVALALVCLVWPGLASAQSTAPAAPAPLTSAKTLFLGMGGAALPGQSQTVASLLYTNVSQALSNGPYTLTQDPRKADLLGVISIQSELSDVSSGSSSNNAFVRLVLVDPSTRAVLWTLNEDLQGAYRKTTFERNLGTTTRKLATDVQALAAGKLP